VDQHVGAGAHDRLLIRQRRRMRVDEHPVLVRLVDDRVVDLGRQLRVRAAAIVHPDLHLPDVLRRERLHGRPRFGGGRDLVHHVQRGRGDAQHGVGTAARRREAGHEDIPRGRRELPCLLILLNPQRLIGGAAADRLRGADAVECLALQMVEHVLRRVIRRAPARVALVADVHVHVDHRGHDGLPRQIHARGAGGNGDRARAADGEDAAVLDDERAALDRRARVAEDQPRAFVHDSLSGAWRLCVRRERRRHAHRHPRDDVRSPEKLALLCLLHSRGF
jgi:hypothetical protein